MFLLISPTFRLTGKCAWWLLVCRETGLFLPVPLRRLPRLPGYMRILNEEHRNFAGRNASLVYSFSFQPASHRAVLVEQINSTAARSVLQGVAADK